MKIGIDLDNTLIAYDKVFAECGVECGYLPSNWQGNKSEVKAYLLAFDGGEKKWQILQGQVYGRYLYRAELFPGVHRFLLRCKARDIRVEIISHKTEYGHEDPHRVSLRRAALTFLSQNGLYSTREEKLIDRVEFCDTRSEKISRIVKGSYDWFIDDLQEVLTAARQVNCTKTMLFQPHRGSDSDVEFSARSWNQIEQELLGKWDYSELASVSRKVIGSKPLNIEWVGGRGNSGVAKASLHDGRSLAVKIYSDDLHHDRLQSEYEGYLLIRDSAVKNVPESVVRSKDLNIAAYSWIEGEPINIPNEKDIDEAIVFVDKLFQLSRGQRAQNFQNASAAIFSGQSATQQMLRRIELLQRDCVQGSPLAKYLKKELSPMSEEILKSTKREWSGPLGYSDIIPRSGCTLSPSDFGFHNAIRTPANEIVFLDFEYFGWDDPAKLMGDFLLHPGMGLTSELGYRWIVGVKKIFGDESLRRLARLWPTLQMLWCLIVLNVYIKEVVYRRLLANSSMSREWGEVLERQLRISQSRLASAQLNSWKFPYLDLIS